MTDATKALLLERAQTYGSFEENARIAQSLKYVCQYQMKWDPLPSIMKESLELICTKIARILSGDPHHKDSWDDIAGYATLAAMSCEERNDD